MDSNTDITVEELARVLRVHRTSVLRWIELGRVKAYRLPGGGGYRIPAVEVDRIRQPITVGGKGGG